jgi:hypothetical protein
LAAVSPAGADIIVRSGWRRVRWLDEAGERLDLLKMLTDAGTAGRIDRRICLGRKVGPPLPVRLIAIRKAPEQAAASRDKARREADKETAKSADGTLQAAEWMLLVSALSAACFATDDIAELDRARWRIEKAFKRLKSVVGLSGPPGQDAQVAKTWILAHLVMILLLEPHTSGLAVSPRRALVRLAASQLPLAGV